MLLHTEAFTHRSFDAQMLLHTEALTHRSFDAQMLLHTEAFTHRSFNAQMLLHTLKLLHTAALTHRCFYTQKLLHTAALTHRCIYTQKLLHTAALTHRCLYTHRSFYTPQLWRTNASTHRRLYTQTLSHTEVLHTAALTHRCFYTQKPLHTAALTHRCFYTHLLRNILSNYWCGMHHTCKNTSVNLTGTVWMIRSEKLWRKSFYVLARRIYWFWCSSVRLRKPYSWLVWKQFEKTTCRCLAWPVAISEIGKIAGTFSRHHGNGWVFVGPCHPCAHGPPAKLEVLHLFRRFTHTPSRRRVGN